MNNGRIIELEIDPDDPKYTNIAQIKGVDGPNKALATNKNEDFLYVNVGKSIGVKLINNENQGIKETGIVIESKQQNVVFDDYVPLKRNGIITANSLGVLEVFSLNLQERNYRKLAEYNINQNARSKREFQQITTIAINDTEDLLAVGTCIEDSEEVKLKNLIVFEILKSGQLDPLDARDFDQNPGDAMYFYLNFEYTYKGYPILFAFQADGDRRADAFLFKEEKLELVSSEKFYHKKGFSAIRDLNGKIFSVDYDGVMRVLNIPE